MLHQESRRARGRESARQRNFLWKIDVFRLIYLFADFLAKRSRCSYSYSRPMRKRKRLIVNERSSRPSLSFFLTNFNIGDVHRKREEGQRGVSGKSHDAIPRPQKRKLKWRASLIF